MVGSESLRWVLTVAFVLASGYHLARVLWVCRPVGADRISEMLHLTMGISMVAMIWPWGDVVPASAWVAVFTVSTGWFVARTVRPSGRRLAPAFFATTMAIMVWMGVMMPAPGRATAIHGMSEMSGGRPFGPAVWISSALGGYLVLAAFWWFFHGLRLTRLAGLLPTDPAAGGARQRDPATAIAPARPLRWSSMCHGLMCIGMGLALLAMA